MLYAQSERYRRLSVPLSAAGRDTLKEHKEIVDAALAGDDDRAVALLSSHLKNTTRILLDADITESVNRFNNSSELTAPK